MTHRDYHEALERVTNTFISPALDLIKETNILISEAENRAIRAEATLEALRTLHPVNQITCTLQLLQSFGCPACSGDCGGANPPVTTCPMQEIQRALDLLARLTA